MSHLDTYDHKPKLAELSGQPMPESFTKGQQIASSKGNSSSASPPISIPKIWQLGARAELAVAAFG
ncbi:MAG: hypothetical protein R3C56_17920 [Pirellulaceae bacterium]